MSLQIFEWWYFRKYGMSFIEQISVNHLGPLLGGGEEPEANTSQTNDSKQSRSFFCILFISKQDFFDSVLELFDMM